MDSKKKSKGKTGSMESSVQESAFEESLAAAKSSKSDKKFDTVIGYIEDIIMDESFQRLQNTFLEKYYRTFDDVEENKLIYTEIHKEYTQLIETFLEQELHRRMPGFKMAEFQKQLVTRRNELDGEIFEILLTFTDFLAFKELVLDFKAEKEGRSFNLGDGFKVSKLNESTAIQNEMELDRENGDDSAEHESMNLDNDDDDDGGRNVVTKTRQNGFDFGLSLVGSGIRPTKKN